MLRFFVGFWSFLDVLYVIVFLTLFFNLNQLNYGARMLIYASIKLTSL